MDTHSFDQDEVVQIARIMTANDYPFNLITVTQLPAIHYQLREAGLANVDVWQAYDEIQGIDVTAGTPMNVNELPFPPGVTPVYLEGSVRYYQGEDTFALVHLYKDGFVWQVDYPQADGTVMTDQYDDRGLLLTRTKSASDHAVLLRQWYSPAGDVVMIATQGGGVQIMDVAASRFDQRHYPSVEAVVAEVLGRHIAQDHDELAITGPFSGLLALRSLRDLRLRLGVLMSSRDLAAGDRLKNLGQLARHDLIISPTHTDLRIIQQSPLARRISHVPQVVLPTRATTLSLGVSNELAEQIIAWRVGDASDSLVRQVMATLTAGMAKHDDWQLVIGTASTAQQTDLTDHVQAWVADKYGVDLDSDDYQQVADYFNARAQGQMMVETERVGESLKKRVDWSALSGAYSVLARIAIRKPLSITDWGQQIHSARIVINTDGQSDLSLQVLAVSAGIPQLNMAASDLLIDHQNGRLVHDSSDIARGLDYYLGTLAHWNQALVVNAQLIERYSAERIIAAWKKVMSDGAKDN
ncbi:hypothetical protein FD19_GL001443 [Lacticaseibacillus thailandensis DSM 22698 = JCM 13996]|uniref:Accessory Sec system protein Asp1 n=2 Tax=Lacticaseibacillus thailandensis TaxID=381741 RepID=A0A0R2C7S5_9LACO|nr:hypothetical protein FD19_GL001443 [Lacticaseibacillus thailandensis DSM 22698 = JCM 13996]